MLDDIGPSPQAFTISRKWHGGPHGSSISELTLNLQHGISGDNERNDIHQKLILLLDVSEITYTGHHTSGSTPNVQVAAWCISRVPLIEVAGLPRVYPVALSYRLPS